MYKCYYKQLSDKHINILVTFQRNKGVTLFFILENNVFFFFFKVIEILLKDESNTETVHESCTVQGYIKNPTAPITEDTNI